MSHNCGPLHTQPCSSLIYFGGHQRVIAAATIGGWSKLRREPYVRHELSMIGRAVKKMSF
jgi:hypothetical protein